LMKATMLAESYADVYGHESGR
jgi:hypothetical protein